MHVRVMKNQKRAGFYSCAHIVETYYEDGIRLELCNINGDEGKRKVIRMPRDGNIAYYIDDSGKTVDTRHWPPRKKRRGRAPRPNSITSKPLHMRG